MHQSNMSPEIAKHTLGAKLPPVEKHPFKAKQTKVLCLANAKQNFG